MYKCVVGYIFLQAQVYSNQLVAIGLIYILGLLNEKYLGFLEFTFLSL